MELTNLAVGEDLEWVLVLVVASAKEVERQAVREVSGVEGCDRLVCSVLFVQLMQRDSFLASVLAPSRFESQKLCELIIN